jgi:hypothetical protein
VVVSQFVQIDHGVFQTGQGFFEAAGGGTRMIVDCANACGGQGTTGAAACGSARREGLFEAFKRFLETVLEPVQFTQTGQRHTFPLSDRC